MVPVSEKPRFASLFTRDANLVDLRATTVVVVLAIAAVAAILRAAGMPWRQVLFLTPMVVFLAGCYGVLAWRMPRATVVAAPVGICVMYVMKTIEILSQRGATDNWPARLTAGLLDATQGVLIIYVPVITTVWIVSILRRQALQRSLDQALARQGQETAARQVAEARASLLQ